MVYFFQTWCTYWGEYPVVVFVVLFIQNSTLSSHRSQLVCYLWQYVLKNLPISRLARSTGLLSGWYTVVWILLIFNSSIFLVHFLLVNCVPLSVRIFEIILWLGYSHLWSFWWLHRRWPSSMGSALCIWKKCPPFHHRLLWNQIQRWSSGCDIDYFSSLA